MDYMQIVRSDHIEKIVGHNVHVFREPMTGYLFALDERLADGHVIQNPYHPATILAVSVDAGFSPDAPATRKLLAPHAATLEKVRSERFRSGIVGTVSVHGYDTSILLLKDDTVSNEEFVFGIDWRFLDDRIYFEQSVLGSKDADVSINFLSFARPDPVFVSFDEGGRRVGKKSAERDACGRYILSSFLAEKLRQDPHPVRSAMALSHAAVSHFRALIASVKAMPDNEYIKELVDAFSGPALLLERAVEYGVHVEEDDAFEYVRRVAYVLSACAQKHEKALRDAADGNPGAQAYAGSADRSINRITELLSK